MTNTATTSPDQFKTFRDAAGSAENDRFLAAQIAYLSQRVHDLATENLFLKQALAAMSADAVAADADAEAGQADDVADQTRDTDPAT